jgi:hypothetical protein
MLQLQFAEAEVDGLVGSAPLEKEIAKSLPGRHGFQIQPTRNHLTRVHQSLCRRYFF